MTKVVWSSVIVVFEVTVASTTSVIRVVWSSVIVVFPVTVASTITVETGVLPVVLLKKVAFAMVVDRATLFVLAVDVWLERPGVLLPDKVLIGLV